MAKQAKTDKQNSLGITVKKAEDTSEWYSQVIQKAELIEHTDVSGCSVFRPRSFAMWEKIREFFDFNIKQLGVKNCYFPMFIPKKLLTKEEDHIDGFAPEVAWVTKGGNTELNEPLAIRPTSETIMYDTFKKWIRSHRDLPLKINQWCNVVRWEFNNPQPFLRNREFLWQEGHTVFAKKEEAEAEVSDILDIYAQVCEELLAVPVMKGKKTEEEKFAGADYTLSAETFLGKGLQMATSHHLGQSFAKAFDISYLDENSENALPYQNSWGFSTRTIGAMILMHGDDKGLVIPPRLAEEKAVIVPILFDKSKESVLNVCEKLKNELSDFEVFVDDREGYSPGFKYSEWELKGVPLRIEVGPKDVEKGQAVLVRRDSGEKQFVPLTDLKTKIEEALEAMQKDLLEKARARIAEDTVFCTNKKGIEKALNDKKLVLMPWRRDWKEERFKEHWGAKTLTVPFDQSAFKEGMECALTGEPADCVVYVAKSY